MYGILDDNSELIAKFVAPLRVTSNQPAFVSDSLSLKRSVKARSGQRWEVAAPVAPLSTSANKLFAMFVEKGNRKVFDITMPQNYGAVFNRKDLNAVVGNASAGATTVLFSTYSFIPAGTFIKFANHDKVYMTLEDRNRSGLVKITPPLRTQCVATLVSWREDVIMKAYLESDVISGMSYTDGILMDNGELTFIEAL